MKKKSGKYYHIFQGDTITIPKTEVGKLKKVEQDFTGRPIAYLEMLKGKQIKTVPVEQLRKVTSPTVRNLFICPRCGSGIGYHDQVYGKSGIIGCILCVDPVTKMVRLY